MQDYVYILLLIDFQFSSYIIYAGFVSLVCFTINRQIETSKNTSTVSVSYIFIVHMWSRLKQIKTSATENSFSRKVWGNICPLNLEINYVVLKMESDWSLISFWKFLLHWRIYHACFTGCHPVLFRYIVLPKTSIWWWKHPWVLLTNQFYFENDLCTLLSIIFTYIILFFFSDNENLGTMVYGNFLGLI